MNFINKCSVCNAATTTENIKPLISEEEQKKLLNKIYLGKITKRNLPIDIYLKITSELENSLADGYGGGDLSLVKPMIQNIHHFAAAKTYQMVRECEDKRANGKNVVSEKTFLDKVGNTIGDFLGAYLFAEKDHTEQVGVVTKKWHKLTNRKSIPYLEYVTKKDNRVRPAHVVLDGIIRRQDDAFWNTFYPPNGWLCRCETTSTAKGVDTDLKDFDMEEALQDVPQVFRYNFSKENIVFPSDHPYFTVPNADKIFARKNFNLPIK